MVDYIAGLSLLSPGSDAFYGTQDLQFILGRDGNDTISLYDPAGNPDQPQNDVVLPDIVRGELPGERIPRDWKDTIVLGDWQQPYYVNSQPSNLGINEALYLVNFQPQLDTIRLYGTKEEYGLLNIPNLGQALFWLPQENSSPGASYWQQKTVPDFIAFFVDSPQLRDIGIPPLSPLSLDADYFQFVGNTPPAGPVNNNIQQIGTRGHEVSISPAVGSATDPFGNVYLVSSTTGSLGGQNYGSFDAYVAKYDNSGNQLWIKQYGTPGFELTPRIATDKFGNFYTSGYTTGDLGGTNQGAQDAYIAKYDTDGNQLWVQQFGTPLIDAAFGLDVDPDGNVFLSGIVGQLVAVPGQEDPVFTEKAWVAQYDTNGNRQYYQEFGSPAPASQESYATAVDRNGNQFSTGWTSGAIDPSLPGRIGVYDTWISKHDGNGNLDWIKQFGTTDYEFAWGVDTDSQGNVYATGWTLGSLSTFGGTNAGSYDAWLAKYDSVGNQLWIQQFGTVGDDAALSVNIDDSDNIFLTGYTNGNLGASNSGSYDAWVAKFDINGNKVWSQQFGTPQLEHGTHISTDNAGHLFVAGLTEGSLGAVNAGSVDTWLAKLDAKTGSLIDFSGSHQPGNNCPPPNLPSDNCGTHQCANNPQTVDVNGNFLNNFLPGVNDQLVAEVDKITAYIQEVQQNLVSTIVDSIPTTDSNNAQAGNNSNDSYDEGNNTDNSNRNFYGDASDNTLYGTADNDKIYAGEGNNKLYACHGNDTLYGGAGDDIIDAGEGNNLIYAAEGNNTISAGAGDDIIYAGAGNDIINAGAGTNLIYAGEGDNIIDGGKGNNTIYSGSGHDLFVLGTGEGTNQIINFESGKDLLGLSGGFTFEQLSITEVTTQGSNGTEFSTQIGVASSDQILATLNWVHADAITSSSFTHA